MWSATGDSVGFQHGRDGLWVWDTETDQSQQIYQPPDDVLSTSSPLWSPDGQRLVFLTAMRHSDDTAPPLGQGADWDANPEGRMFHQVPVDYDCWTCRRGEDRRLSEPVRLFRARCLHSGLIAANLAVRWHPSGNRLFYLNRKSAKTHQVFEFDLASGDSHLAYPFEAEVLLVDWSPTGERVACVVQNANDPMANGVWIGSPDEKDWWQVPYPLPTLGGENVDVLARTQDFRPVWSRGGKRFAFAGPAISEGPTKDQNTSVLYVGDVKSQTVRELYRQEGSIHDVHWGPDGQRLGYLLHATLPQNRPFSPLQGAVVDVLLIQELSDSEPRPATLHPVRSFAGWNASGTSLAYTVPNPAWPNAEMPWAFLLMPRAGARDRMMIADASGKQAEREVFSGMRATFLNWSPSSDELSLWGTFTPSHDLLPFGGSGGLRPGDPAALLDTQTGALQWMPIHAREQVQIGHYNLLKQNYAEALRWYEKAEKAFSEQVQAELVAPADWDRDPRRFEFFHYCCLKQLGKHEAAKRKLFEFFQKTESPPPQPEPGPQRDRPVNPERSGEEQIILRQLYMAQVFLSLNAIKSGVTFFEQFSEMLPRLVPKRDLADERFGSQLALAQLLLNAKRYDDYAALATTVLVPSLLQKDLSATDARTIVEIGSIFPAVSAGGFCLLPLMADEFVQELSPETLAQILPAWEEYRNRTNSQVARLWIDRFLALSLERLGHLKEAGAARRRYDANPQKAKYDFDETFDSELFNFLRVTFSMSDFLQPLGLAEPSSGL